MKNLLIILIMIVCQSAIGQKTFKNINGETCIELYTTSDLIGEYTVYMIYDKYENPLTEQDKKILKDWKKLDDEARLSAVQLWSNTGKRIESERLPMIKNYFKQADLDFETKVIPNVRKIEQDTKNYLKSFRYESRTKV